MYTKPDQVNNSISNTILQIGECPTKGKGGISTVINTYSKFFDPFVFVATYKPQSNKIFVTIYYLLAFFKTVGILIFNSKLKIVHIHGAAKGSFFRKFFIFFVSKFVFQKRIIYHIHGSEFEVFFNKSSFIVRQLIVFFINRVDTVICLSTKWHSFISSNFSPKKVIILENIVESPSGNRALRSKREIVKLLFLGYIGDRKGIFDLIDVIRENRSILEGRLILAVGGNGDIERLDRVIRDNSLESLVNFEGWVSGERKQELLLDSDIYILPSYNEGLPVSILEAMTHNLPVISTPIGGIPEVVHENINGFLVTPGDKEGLLKSILKFVDNPAIIERMGKANEPIVRPYYSNIVIPKLFRIYETLLNV